MATALIASGNTVATSADITVTYDPVTIFLTPADLKAEYKVQILFKNSANAYVPFSTLTNPELSTVLAAPGIYQVKRLSGTVLVDKS